ncbi:MAG: methyltransferase domain-containing protein [Candidatus Latescibacteria bacterium]|nr:methyltransferase domain-containing protein [Candidatus Latescibacterota bacterium]
MTEKVIQFWTSRAGKDFDRKAGRSGRLPAIERLAEWARPHLMGDQTTAIDLGCGTGLFAQAVGNRNIIGIDCSESFAEIARQRMDKVILQSLFEVQFPPSSIGQASSLFVIDDYPIDQKRAFFRQIFAWLKPGGRLFFAAYSPNDERMGTHKVQINQASQADFTIYLEEAAVYESLLSAGGFQILQSELLTAKGYYQNLGAASIAVGREFILLEAQKL